MISSMLHKDVVVLDREKHRQLRLDRGATSVPAMSQLNSMFVAAVEFADACKDTPVVWVRAGQGPDGKPLYAPVAVFGVQPSQNLCIDGDRWRVRYVPAMLRFYPFALVRTGEDQAAVCIDQSWPGLSNDTGERLFDDEGKATELMTTIQRQLEELEVEIERTRLLGELLMAKGLLQDMRFEATLSDGSKLNVDGFYSIDDKKLAALPDADLLDLQKKGVMSLIHAQQISMGNMRRLVDWHVERIAQGGAAASA
jgi:SapC